MKIGEKLIFKESMITCPKDHLGRHIISKSIRYHNTFIENTCYYQFHQQ